MNGYFKDFSSYIIKAGFSDSVARKCFESFLIHKLDTFNNGMNQDAGLLRFYQQISNEVICCIDRLSICALHDISFVLILVVVIH